MIRSGSAFEMEVPAGSREQVLIDPELLYEFDNPDADPWAVIRPASKEEAVVLLAAGTFPMPEMRGWQEIRAERAGGFPRGPVSSRDGPYSCGSSARTSLEKRADRPRGAIVVIGRSPEQSDARI